MNWAKAEFGLRNANSAFEKKLESQNILKRKRGEEDERTVTIHLTYPGKSLQSKTMKLSAC
ncbi:transcriptional regulator, SarA/Rot family [Algoriphagus boritolerans]|uniref:transcriptional regulator, SarA/Rot family n=1 Tax=Algoriphagus boritolerans TaxID=308111 RepID=UPI000B1E4E63